MGMPLMRTLVLSFILSHLLASCSSTSLLPDQSIRLVLLHTNDVHTHFDPYTSTGTPCRESEFESSECVSGVARLYSAVQKVRAEKKESLDPVLLVDAGDQFFGTYYFTKYQDQLIAELMNEISYDAMAVGNHEFDLGPSVLSRFIDRAKFPVLSANIDASRDPNLRNKIPASMVRTIQLKENNKVVTRKVGFFGLTTQSTTKSSKPGGLVRFRDPILAAKQTVERLQSQGVNIIIALSHLGFENDQELGKKVDGIDVIVSGHTDAYLSNSDPKAIGSYPFPVNSPSGDPVLIVSAYRWATVLGRLEVVFDKSGVATQWRGEPIALDKSVIPDPVIEKKLASYRAPLKKLLEERVAVADKSMAGGGSECIVSECELGNWISDVFYDYGKKYGAEIAFQNSGGIRSSVAKGDLYYQDIYEILPFANRLVVFDIYGKDIKETIEQALVNSHNPNLGSNGGFIQSSGLRYVWDRSKIPGNRVTLIEVKNRFGHFMPLEPLQKYRVVTSDYLKNGGSRLEALKRGIPIHVSTQTDLEIVLDYLKKNPNVSAQIEGRVIQND